jgi:AbiV family abortive infection protein
MQTKNLRAATIAVIENGCRLLEDAKLLEEMSRFPTAYALCILAQEEYGKAFLLYLAEGQSIPWTKGFHRALRNHHCKQLVALLMEYLQRDDFLELLKDPDRFRGASTLPDHVMDAMHIIVHEHMNSLDRDDWLGETREVHPVANRIAQGVLDREKQMGLYVGVDRDGVVRESPAVITADRCRDEIARTEKVSNALSISQGVVSLAASFDVPDSSNL